MSANPAAQSARWWHSLLVIFLVALTLRVAVITVGHTYRITPRRDHFQFGWEMGRIARSIAQGQGFSSPTDLPTGPSAWAPPVYPYILAGVFKLFGAYTPLSGFAILSFNSVFGALTCLTIYGIGLSIYGIAVARAAAWTWAVFPYAIYWPVRVVWEASLSAFLLSLAVLLTLRMNQRPPRRRDWALFGALWGLIALTNTALISLFPVCVGWLLYRRGSGQWSRAMLCLGTTLLVISPWIARNYAVFGKFIFVRDNLPLELYVANNDRSNGLWTRSEHPGNDAEAMQKFQAMGEIGFMEEKARQFRHFLSQHPLRFSGLTVKRFMYFWIGTPQDLGPIALAARHFTFLLASVLAYGGLWLTIAQRRPAWPVLAGLLLVYPLPYYLVNPFPRYKHAIEPEMILLIVFLCAYLKRRWTGRDAAPPPLQA